MILWYIWFLCFVSHDLFVWIIWFICDSHHFLHTTHQVIFFVHMITLSTVIFHMLLFSYVIHMIDLFSHVTFIQMIHSFSGEIFVHMIFPGCYVKFQGIMYFDMYFHMWPHNTHIITCGKRSQNDPEWSHVKLKMWCFCKGRDGFSLYVLVLHFPSC